MTAAFLWFLIRIADCRLHGSLEESHETLQTSDQLCSLSSHTPVLPDPDWMLTDQRLLLLVVGSGH